MTIESEIEHLKQSDLFKLKEKVEKAKLEDRDLLYEMAIKVEEQISKAKETLFRVTSKTKKNYQ